MNPWLVYACRNLLSFMTVALSTLALSAKLSEAATAEKGPKSSKKKSKSSGSGSGPSLTKSGEKAAEYGFPMFHADHAVLYVRETMKVEDRLDRTGINLCMREVKWQSHFVR
jgi:hypothetical protein